MRQMSFRLKICCVTKHKLLSRCINFSILHNSFREQKHQIDEKGERDRERSRWTNIERERDIGTDTETNRHTVESDKLQREKFT